MNAIERAIELKKELDALRPINKADELRIMQKFRLDWNYHSNNLEGNTLSYGETKALLLFHITAQGKPLRDHLEITGHDQAIQWILEVIKEERALTENFIRELHQLILKEPYEVDALTPDGNPTKKKVKIGVYKTTPNHVLTKTGELFRFASPEETPAMMTALMDWYRDKRSSLNFNPILLASEFHYRFIRIHPFDDGNGRTARIVMNFILMQFDYPPVIIKTEDKENYFAALRQADAGILEPFVNYIATNLKSSLVIMIAGAKGENSDEVDDLDKELMLLEQKLKGVPPKNHVVRSEITLLNLFDEVISKFTLKFITDCQKFDKFYETSFLSLNRNIGQTYKKEEINSNQVISYCREWLKSGKTFLAFSYNYRGFQNEGIGKFDFNIEIQLHFEYTTYRFQRIGVRKISIEKKYGEQASDEEIYQLINSEMKRHQSFIVTKIEEANNKAN